MSVIEAILMLCAVGLVVGVAAPIWLIRKKMQDRLSATDLVIGLAATVAGFYLPFAFFFLSDDWVQASLQQYLHLQW